MRRMVSNPSRCPLLLTALLASACSSASGESLRVTMLPPVAAAGSAEPHLARTDDGRVVMSWLEPEGDRIALKYSILQGDAWQPPLLVAGGTDWFVNWADFPSVTPIDDTLWAAHWLVRSGSSAYSYDVNIAISNDAGKTWGKPLTPHDDGTLTEHGFASLFPWQDGIGAIWLDGRNMSIDGHGTGHGGGMTLRSALIGRDGTIRAAQLIDEFVCDCCQTDVATTNLGPVAVYRNRDEHEIRDIHVVRSSDAQWLDDTAVADDGWKIAACPVNGPAIASNGKFVAAAWFTAPEDDTKVHMAWSSDAGRTFAAPLVVDGGRPIGRVDIELLANGSAVVSWLRSGDDGRGEICLRQITSNGEAGAVRIVATTGASRLSGFPQMLRDGSDLVLAWTDTSKEYTQVVAVRIDSTALSRERPQD